MDLIELKDIELFKPLPGSTLTELTKKCQTVVLQSGETLFRDGDAGHTLRLGGLNLALRIFLAFARSEPER